jgi:hypothetical protein
MKSHRLLQNSIAVASLLLPVMVFGATATTAKTFKTLITGVFIPLANSIIVLLVSLALFYFLWGIFKLIASGDSEKMLETGKLYVLWGTVALFVMISMWGLVNIVLVSFFSESQLAPKNFINNSTGSINTDVINSPAPGSGGQSSSVNNATGQTNIFPSANQNNTLPQSSVVQSALVGKQTAPSSSYGSDTATIGSAVPGDAGVTTGAVVGNSLQYNIAPGSVPIQQNSVITQTNTSVSIGAQVGGGGASAGVAQQTTVQNNNTSVQFAVLSVPSSLNFGKQLSQSPVNKRIDIQYSGLKPATFLGLLGFNMVFNFTGGSYPGTGGSCGQIITESCFIMVTFTPRIDKGTLVNGEYSYTTDATYMYNDGSGTRIDRHIKLSATAPLE